jgi:ribonuclease HI
MAIKKKYYSVALGRKTGVFTEWYGPDGAEAQIHKFEGARYKGFATIDEAREWLTLMTGENQSSKKTITGNKTISVKTAAPDHELATKSGKVLIYTDGGCSYNPGPGGYGAVIFNGKVRKEISGGFRLTTNNRMELTACIEALKVLKTSSSVIVCSDSKYIVDAVTNGWARKWRKNGWMRNKTDAAENYDLWEKLLDLCGRHHVEFVWVKGHAGTLENERCDQLATGAAAGKNLPPDKAYESGATRVTLM